jgi:uncharacterized protein YqeY
MIAKDLRSKMGVAMKAHDEIMVSTLRLLLSALNYEQIAMQHELSEEEELAVVRKEVKKRKEAIETLRQALGRSTTANPAEIESRIKKEEMELKILQEYLPPEITDEELEKLVDEAIVATGAKTVSEMGMVIGKVKSLRPDVDGAKTAAIVRQKLLGS